MLSVALSLVFVCCVTAVGQVLKGSISGTITDPQGAVVANAQVKATNVATGAELQSTTDNTGAFRFNLIPTGTYKVDVSAPNFKTLSQTGILVNAGQDTGLGLLKLSVGDTGTTVEVTAETPLIESTQAQVTNTFSGQTLTTFAGVQENEGLDNLALFVPGISSSRDNNFSNTNGGLGFSVNGLRGRNNDQQIDGQNNNDNSVAGPGVFLSDPEWVGQYVIVTNNFGPEYGRNAGSVVNILTKQGSNAWHGSVYGNYNNSVLNSMTNFQRNFDKNARGNPLTGPPTLNDTFSGIQVGGPVVKNKLFVSGGFNNEIINVANPFTSGGITPTTAGLATLAGCFPTGVSAQAVAAVSRFGPFGVTGGNPTASNTTTGVVTTCPNAQFGNVTRTLRTNDHIYDFYGRTDVQWTRDTVVGRYLYNKNTFFNLDDGAQGAAIGYPFNEPALGQTALVSWTHNFGSRMVNELRGAFSRLNVEFGGNTIGNTLPPAGQLNQAPAQITFSTGADVGFGPANNLPQQRIVNTWQVQDNWNYILGHHTVKAGVNWTYQRSPNTFLPIINGTFRFSNWDSFFANTPNRVRVANGPSSLDFREYDTFGYIGDDWKIGHNLTMNLGVTYTYYGQPANLFNDITTKRESNPATAFWSSAVPFVARVNPRIATRKNSFGPSAGFAYAPQWGGIFGGGKTVFRGGYRYLYDPPYYNIYLNVATSAPEVFLQSFTRASAATKPLPAVPTGPNVRAQLSPFLTPGVFDPRTFSQTTIPQNFGPDKVHSWSFGMEREITKNSAIEARYVGNKGYQLFQSVDGNPFIADLQKAFPQFVPPGLTPCPATAQVGPGAGTDVGRVSCGTGLLRTRTNSGFSNYQGVQVEYRANNVFKQLTMRTGYTYSKTLDNVSEIFSTGIAGNTVAFPQNPISPQNGEYSFSGLDYPHTFSVLLSEQLPFFRDQRGLVGHVLGGWIISANYLLQSGQRYTPSQSSEVAAFTAAGDFFDRNFVSAFAGTDTARPFFGSPRAPVTQVGAFAGDACFIFGVTGSEPVCTISPTQLVSVNALSQGGPGNVVPVNRNQVRFIVNGGAAETIFGTPFGNVPRSITQDDMTNIANLAVAKRFKLTERTSFEFRATAVNVLNHPNFLSIDPFLEDAGLFAAGTGFGNPRVTNTVPGGINFPVAASRRLIFGGTVRF
jgi:hypothetical protein